MDFLRSALSVRRDLATTMFNLVTEGPFAGLPTARCAPNEPPAGCPMHKADATPAPPAGVCPVKHDAPAPTAVCPVKHSSSSSSSEGDAAAPTPVCPVRRRPGAATAGTHGSAALLGGASAADDVSEPGDTADRFVRAVAAMGRDSSSSSSSSPAGPAESKIDYPDEVPGGRIPATGRGNSEDGADWVNPTPKELFRALRRKKKHIEEEDAYSVAFVHSVVVDQTWAQIMEYESLHEKECEFPTLASFEGKYGDHTIKTKLTQFFVKGMDPFDRHDWVVDRCGKKEVRYIIDYYSSPAGPDGSEEYFIDARPAPTVEGMIDRARMAWKRWRAGQGIW